MSKAMQLELNVLTRLEDVLHLEKKNVNTVIYFILML